VLSSCKEIQSYSTDVVHDWNGLIRPADTVSPMMGIPSSVWFEAKAKIGHAQTATVLAAMLERFSEIRNPAAYLRYLGQKAELGAFSCATMIRTLGGSKVKVHSCELFWSSS
tara:strand:+ start:1341 stop:1676 length:336 start_codon:yes stop_codon:yes gene_type:complete